MHRTQVYLDEGHYQLLRARAKRQGKSLAAIIREIIDEHLNTGKQRAQGDPLSEVIGIGEGDGAAVAENYEDYLYGEPS